MKITKLFPQEADQPRAENCYIGKVFLCFCVFVFSAFITGCTQKVVESDLDWPVEEVQMANDNREVEVGAPENSAGTVEIAEPEEMVAEVKTEPEEGEVKIVEPAEVALENLENAPDATVIIDSPVSFASQAPYAVWDDLHNEACEEAAMIIAASWFKNKKLEAHTMEQEILSLVKWEEENGYTVDVTVEEATQILKDYFGLQAEVTADVNVNKIKQEISAGKLVIIPAAGRLLGNPYYRRPGPIYHMLVIRGFDESRGEFITNDPGTKRGEGFRYKYQTLINAVHDWPKPGKTKDDVTEAEMNAGRRALILIWK